LHWRHWAGWLISSGLRATLLQTTRRLLRLDVFLYD